MLISPLCLLFFFRQNAIFFVIGLGIYILYRSIIDTERLIKLNIIDKKDRLKLYCSFFKNGKYFNQLYLRRK